MCRLPSRFHIHSRWFRPCAFRRHCGPVWCESSKFTTHHHCHTVTPSPLHCHTTYFSLLQELANPAVSSPSQGYLGEHAVACHLAGWPVTFTPLSQCAMWSCCPVALPTSPLALPPLEHRHSHKHCRTHCSGTPPHTLPADASAIGPSHTHTQIRLS